MSYFFGNTHAIVGSSASATTKEGDDKSTKIISPEKSFLTSARQLLKSLRGLKTGKRSKMLGGNYEHYQTVMSIASPYNVASSGGGVCSQVLLFGASMSGATDWSSFSVLFDVYRLHALTFAYQPQHKYTGYSAGSPYKGVPLALRTDVEVQPGASPLAYTGVILAPPYSGRNLGDKKDLGCHFVNTEEKFVHSTQFPDVFPLVTGSTGGVVNSIGPGCWNDVSQIALQGGGLYVAGATDTLAVSVNYGQAAVWVTVDFAVRI
jgi:hypothetical protein